MVEAWAGAYKITVNNGTQSAAALPKARSLSPAAGPSSFKGFARATLYVMLHYGYFVLLHDGRLVPAGDDWGPTPDTYKSGDSMGVRNDTEAIVVGVVKGDAAKFYGNVDVMVIVDQQPAAGIRNPLPRDLVAGVVAALNQPPSSPGPPTIQTLWKEKNVRVVAIWNKVIFRPPTETFHEFLVEVPLKSSFGEEWYKAEMAKAKADRHIVVRWLAAYREQGQKHRPANHSAGEVYGAPATGETTELIALAHDMYMLQKVNRLPDGLMNRLRNYDGFQGARYEIAIAAAWANLTNMDQITGKTDFQYLNAAPATNNRLTGYGYDAAGNQTNDGLGHGFTFDAEHRMTVADGVTYTYDADNRRVKKSTGVVYWYGAAEQALSEGDADGNLSAEYVLFNGQRLARSEGALN